MGRAETFTVRCGVSVANIFRESLLSGRAIRGDWPGYVGFAVVTEIALDPGCDEVVVTLAKITQS